MRETKYFDCEFDILDYVLDELEKEDIISILCDIDSMHNIKKMVSFSDYNTIDINIEDNCEVYYVSKVKDVFVIEPAVRNGKLIINDLDTIVLDNVDIDYSLFEGIDYQILRLDEIDDLLELSDTEDAEFELIEECVDYILNTKCPDCIFDKIIELAYKFKDIGFTDARDIFREFIEDLD